MKRAYEEGGLEALKEKTRRTPNIKNRVSEEVEQVVGVAGPRRSFTRSIRASDTLKQRGIFISAAGVACVWLRHSLETFKKRLAKLEEQVAKTGASLTNSQLQALQKAEEEKIPMGEIETEHVGYLGAQDTYYYVGQIKGVGRIYQQTFLDTFSSLAFAKRYATKYPINSADLLKDRSLILLFEK